MVIGSSPYLGVTPRRRLSAVRRCSWRGPTMMRRMGHRSVPLELYVLRLGPADPKRLRHSHQIGQRTRTHFPHDMAAMDLHRELGEFQFARDLLVHHAGSDQA